MHLSARCTRILRALLAVPALVAGAGSSFALQLELDYADGRLSSQVVYSFSGGANELVVFLPSAFPGPTPLALIEPLDPRFMEVGLDLLGYLTYVPLGPAGQNQLTLSLPANPSIAGATIYAQAVSLGAAIPMVPFFGDLSNPTAFSLLSPGQSSTTNQPMGTARRFHSATPVPGGPAGSARVLLLGGESPFAPFGALSSWELYDATTEKFTPGGGTLLDRRSRHAAASLLDGRVLVCGGVGGSAGGALASVEIYLPGVDQMQAAAPMAQPRVGHTATRLLDGRVLVVGGFSGPFTKDHPLGYPESFLGSGAVVTSFAAFAELYDPSNGSWSQVSSIGPRAGHGAVLLADGSVLIAGGVVPGAVVPQETASSLRFDPVLGVATSTGSLPVPRAFVHMSPAQAGAALLVGGGNVSLGAGQVTVGATGQATLRFDPLTSTWGPIAPEPTNSALAFVQCVRMPDGSIRYIRIDGRDDRIDTVVAVGPTPVHVLDTAAGLWLLDGQTFDRRPGLAITPLDVRTRLLLTGSATAAIPGGTGLPDRTAEAYPYPN